MCLSTVMQYKDDPQEAQEMFSNITGFEVQDSKVVFTDLLGAEYSLEGVITKVDFVQSKIYIAS